MACHNTVTVDGMVGYVCVRERRRRCVACGELGAERLCDGKKPSKKSGTCDAPVCVKCAFRMAENVDLCPPCFRFEEKKPMDTRPPPGVRTSECRSCKLEIIWVRMHTGNLNPVDSVPVANGNIVLSKSAVSGEIKGEPFDENHHAGRRRFVSHFATCKFAESHRKPKAEQLGLDVNVPAKGDPRDV